MFADVLIGGCMSIRTPNVWSVKARLLVHHPFSAPSDLIRCFVSAKIFLEVKYTHREGLEVNGALSCSEGQGCNQVMLRKGLRLSFGGKLKRITDWEDSRCRFWLGVTLVPL